MAHLAEKPAVSKPDPVRPRQRSFRLGSAAIPYYFGSNLASFAAEILAGLQPSCFLMVVDSAVHETLGRDYERTLQRIAPVHSYVLVAGERNKQLTTLTALVAWAQGVGADRRSVVLALGGGVVGNVAGMLAHLALRGLRLVHVPTTLMAAFDSVLSLKQAVNVHGVKNFVGAYHAAEAILCDACAFESLSTRDIRAGLAEPIKNSLIAEPRQVDLLLRLGTDVAHYDVSDYERLWEASIEAKCPWLADDPYEQRAAIMFEYGHTVGHAIEAAACGRVRHGEAVATGLLVEARVAQRLGLATRETVEIHDELVARFHLPATVDRKLFDGGLEAYLRRDNKRGTLKVPQDSVAMVLLRDLGKPAYTEDLPLVPVAVRDVMRAVSDLTA